MSPVLTVQVSDMKHFQYFFRKQYIHLIGDSHKSGNNAVLGFCKAILSPFIFPKEISLEATNSGRLP